MNRSSLLPRMLVACVILVSLSECLRAQNLAPEKVAQLKAASVFIDVKVLGRHGSGSGFVVKNAGEDTIIITNDHVVNIEHELIIRGREPSGKVKPEIRVVFDSGTLKERTAVATILANDPHRDLAVLKVSKVKDPPKPVDFKDPPKLVELMPLTICGYPLGKSTAVGEQNPSCTTTALTISNIRMDLSTGHVKVIQVSGSLEPGNSGSPIVSSADGKLVGVAVSGFEGTQLSYAIPLNEVLAVLAGTHGHIKILPNDYAAKKEGPAQLRVALVDPFKTVKGVTAYYRDSLPDGKPMGQPEVMADSKKVELRIENGLAVGLINSPAKGKMAVQVEVELASGKVLSPPQEVSIAAEEVAEPPFFASTPEPKAIPEDLRKAGPQDKLYPLPQDHLAAIEANKSGLDWYRAQIVKPFLEDLKSDASYGPKVRAALDATAVFHYFQSVSPRRATFQDYSLESLEAVYKAGCRRPEVKLLLIHHSKLKPSASEPVEEMRAILESFEKDKVPMYLQVLAALRCAKAMHVAHWQKEKVKTAYEQAIQKLAKLATDSSSVAEHATLNFAEQIQSECVAAGWDKPTCFRELNEAVATAGASKAFLQTLKGEYLLGGEKDGEDNPAASDPSRFQEARTVLEAAWEADKTRDRAATAMIAVVAGLKLPRAEVEKWFQRAMTANPNNYKACRAKLQYLLAQGTEADRLAFGRQCLRTRNYLAGLPYILVLAHLDGKSKVNESFVKSDIAWADVREYYERVLQIWPGDRVYLAEFAICCVGAGQWAAAKQHLAGLKSRRPPTGIFPTKHDYDLLVKRVDEHLNANKKPKKK